MELVIIGLDNAYGHQNIIWNNVVFSKINLSNDIEYTKFPKSKCIHSKQLHESGYLHGVTSISFQ